MTTMIIDDYVEIERPLADQIDSTTVYISGRSPTHVTSYDAGRTLELFQRHI